MWWRKGTNSSNSSSLAAWQPGPGLRPSRRQQQQLHPSHLYALPNWAPAEHVLVSLSCQQQQEEEQQRVRREAGEAEAVCGAVWVLCFWAHCWFQHNLVSYGMLLLLSLLLLQRVGALAKYLYSAWHEPADTLHTPALSKQTRRNICTHTHTHTWVWKTKWVACWLSHLYTQAERAAAARCVRVREQACRLCSADLSCCFLCSCSCCLRCCGCCCCCCCNLLLKIASLSVSC